MPRDRKSTLDKHIEELNTLLKKHAIIEQRIKTHKKAIVDLSNLGGKLSDKIDNLAGKHSKMKTILDAHTKSLDLIKKTINGLITNQRKIRSYGNNVYKNINGVAQNKTDIKKLSSDLQTIKLQLEALNNNVNIVFKKGPRSNTTKIKF